MEGGFDKVKTGIQDNGEIMKDNEGLHYDRDNGSIEMEGKC